ncbi:MAG TPA: CAAX prenyl protease-related protein [Verrucomicrobiae bacterium]|nr:CAAX prenyl protease-related protein [Verrucomicrobiae bacterium]
MRLLQNIFSRSPLIPRAAPFILFVLLTAFQGRFGAASAYWFYFAKTIVGAWLIWEMRPFVSEMRWAISWEAIAIGVLIFAIWVGLDTYYPKFSKPGMAWNPNLLFGEHSALAWLFIVTRILGSTFIVPPLEEVFYRSFLYRYLASQNFLSVPLNKFLPLPFFVTAGIFGFSHYQWLAGILCGAAYQWLVLRKNRLGDAMTAHAITNFLLGVWVVWHGAWNFW